MEAQVPTVTIEVRIRDKPHPLPWDHAVTVADRGGVTGSRGPTGNPYGGPPGAPGMVYGTPQKDPQVLLVGHMGEPTLLSPRLALGRCLSD
jgi:hypothetical protein